MNWLNKILGSEDKKPASASPVVARKAAEIRAPVADPQLLRQRLAQAQSEAQRMQLQGDLGAALGQSGIGPAAGDPSPVRSGAVVNAADKLSALSWLADLTDEDSLAEVALHAHFAEVRLAAAQRLTATAVLERVAQASRVKDKGVYRLCTNTLRQRQAASDCAQRATVLERELALLLAATPVAASHLVDLEREFKQLGGVDLRRCEQLIEEVRARVQEQSRHLQRLHARHLAAQALADELARQPVLQQEQWQQLCERWQQLRSADGVADAWPDWLAKHKELVALNLLGEAVDRRLSEAGEDLERFRQCELFVETHGGAAELGEDTLAAWQALGKPQGAALCAEVEARWAACVQRAARNKPAPVAAPAALPHAAPRPPKDHQQAQHLIAQMEAAVEQGHLQQAGKLETQIEVAAAGGLSHGLAQRFGAARAQLAKLRGWARWGGDQARQQLILLAEGLAQPQDDVEQLAKAIAKLRQEWKSLDAHGAATRSMWEQFDATVTRAYAPVTAHRAEQAARRDAARQAKEALCQEWEQWLAQISWEHADMRVIQARRQEICDTWRAAVPAGMREERGLRKRFDSFLAGVDARIDAARRQEAGRCEDLIGAAAALRQMTSLRQAIESIKTLQQRWRDEATSVRLPRAEQEKLWQRFRGACDAVFARREEEKSQQDAQRLQRAEEAQLRLAELEAALAQDDIGQLQQRLLEFRASWRDVKQVSAAAKDVLQRAETHLKALQLSKRLAPFQLMAQKMALVEQIEGAAATGQATDELARQVETAWQGLSRLPERFEQALARRRAAAANVTAASLAEGSKRREEVLLDLEIGLGLGASDSGDAARRTRQLQLLQQRFRKDQAAPADPQLQIAQWYATPAVPDQSQQRRMDAILEALGRKT